jgi:two-component system OmpR family response regulator
MRILLVEDDIMIGEALCVALKDAAYAVDWVKDGDSALLVVAQQAHQVVLLDLGLPKRDGIDVLRHMRNAGNSTPIMIMTARDAIAQL